MLKSLLFIFVGGGLGSVLRFGITDALNQNFPYGTLLANLLGSLLIGIVLGLFEREIFGQTHLLLFAVGFCGGFTTFSSFAADNLKLLQQGDIINFILYAVGSLILGIGMVLLGFKLIKLV